MKSQSLKIPSIRVSGAFRTGRIMAFALNLSAALGMLGCGVYDGVDFSDGSGDGGTGGVDDGQNPPLLAGHEVNCCFDAVVRVGTKIETVPVCVGLGSECIDPGASHRNAGDLDADGELSSGELANFCDQKCNFIPGTNIHPAWQLASWATVKEKEIWTLHSEIVSCTGNTHSSITAENACQPMPPKVYGEFSGSDPERDHRDLVIPPDGASEIELQVLGEKGRASFAGSGAVSLLDCDERGVDGGTCSLTLQSFDLDLVHGMTFGGYKVSSARTKIVNQPTAKVVFAKCKAGWCSGQFEFDEHAFAARVSIKQQNIETGRLGQGVLELGGKRGLGSGTRVTGRIDVSELDGNGTLRLDFAGNGGKDSAVVVSGVVAGKLVPKQ